MEGESIEEESPLVRTWEIRRHIGKSPLDGNKEK